MKGSRLLSEILKGQFAIDCHNVEAYFPLIDKLIAGENFTFNNQPKAILNIVSAEGKPLKTNVDGQKIITPGSIAVVSMHGEVIKNGDWCVYGADEIVAALTKAQENENVAATILDIDGPGGAVSAVGLFQEFANNVKNKPIIGLCDSALSLHYWTAIELCDHIMAANQVSARFGSIGVFLTFADNRKALEEKGYKIHEIYPEESSFKNKPYILAREGKYDLIKQEHLSPLAQEFQNAVREKRGDKLKEAADEGLLKGKTFFAKDALKYGLIDSIGGMSKAINVARLKSSMY